MINGAPHIRDRTNENSDRFQKAFVGQADRASIGHKIELTIAGFDQQELHLPITFEAGHLSRRLKTCARRCRSGSGWHVPSLSSCFLGVFFFNSNLRRLFLQFQSTPTPRHATSVKQIYPFAILDPGGSAPKWRFACK
jgi:hypothetical protein